MLGLLPKIEQHFSGISIKAGRYDVTPKDFGIALLILKHCTEDANPDGSLPHARIASLWSALFNVGDISRPFNHHRFTAIRNWLSDHGYVTWVDNSYFPTHFIGSLKVDGKAMKYGLSLEVMDWFREREASLMVTTIQELKVFIRPMLKYPPYNHPAVALDVFIRRSHQRLEEWAYGLAA